MKKVLLVFAIVSTAYSLKAQFVYVQGGLNLANITNSDNGGTDDNKTLATFNVGAMVRLDLSDVFDLETGLLFTGRGSKTETSINSNNYSKEKFNPYYIELPLNAVIKLPLQPKAKTNIFLYAGPYVAMGVAGKSKIEGQFLGADFSSSKDIAFNDDDPTTEEQEDARYDRLKRFDFGGNFGAGIDFGNVILKANYGLGLSKINSTNNNNTEDDKNKYRTFSVSVGIPLGR